MVDLPHYSRYVNTESIFWDGESSFGLYEIPDKIKNLEPKDLINFKVEPGYAGRPDLISEKYYKTPYFSWVIIMHNNPINPIGWPKVGSIISIPKESVVDEVIRNR